MVTCSLQSIRYYLFRLNEIGFIVFDFFCLYVRWVSLGKVYMQYMSVVLGNPQHTVCVVFTICKYIFRKYTYHIVLR